MQFIIFVLLLTTATASSSTHVNISFTQQHLSTDSKRTGLQDDQVQLKESDSFQQLNNEDKSRHFARIKVADQNAPNDLSNNQKKILDAKPIHESQTDYHSEPVQNEGRNSYFGSQLQNQQRTAYSSNHDVQNNIQFRSLSPQDKQNLEFERYIQNYHSGPTVETVYESAKPEAQHIPPTTTVHEGSQRVVKFERQVALPTKADSVQTTSDVIKPIPNHQSVIPSATGSTASTSSSLSPHSLSPSVPSVSLSSTSGNSLNVNPNQEPSVVGKDRFNLGVSYNKPNYNDANFQNNDEYSDTHIYNQFPPSVEEYQGGFGDYYSKIYGRQQVADDYHTVEQRPVVTKTIQIAQPAIKAKKYEVRHPAIQKEFYDIEERVVIKPAGTVVVELERPSAKILKEETTLPLGHPHPAVAAAYMPSRNTPTFSNIIYSNAGPSSLHHQNNNYIPNQGYNKKIVPDHSTTYDQSQKETIPESTENKPYNRFSASATPDIPRPQNNEIVVITDGHGNQRQIPTDQFTYSQDETDKASTRLPLNHKNSFSYENNGRFSGQATKSQQRSGFQANRDNREEFAFEAEYINNSGKINSRNENSPARLQEASSEKVTEQKQQAQPIIKHEHKIVLSPSQHNIYLSQNHEVPKTKFIEETANVRALMPQNHRRPIVVFSPAKQMPDLKYSQRPEYRSPARVSAQVMQYHNNSPQRSQLGGGDSPVQYSAPYAQMRHHSNEGGNKEEQHHRKIASHRKSEELILEDKPLTDVKVSPMENLLEKQATQAHIEVKIPNPSSNDDNKAIFVSSTIGPMRMDDNQDQTHNSKLEISVTNNGAPQQEQILKDELDNSEQYDINDNNKNKNTNDILTEDLLNNATKHGCDDLSKSAISENYELTHQHNNYMPQKFMRIVENPNAVSPSTGIESAQTPESATVQANAQPHNTDINQKSSVGHVSPPGSRILASTAASKELTPSESFHKRRIVVNHPFQTVREVVEHEPYTNYHEVQVNEPATPALYHSDNYYQPNGDLRQSENRYSVSPSYYH